MLVVISPAKKLDENCDLDVISKFTVPPYLESSKKIIKALRGYSADNLSKLMNTSEKISELNYNRNIKWSLPFNKSNSLQALLMFKGDVYKGISVKDFNKDDFLFAQKSLRILSGLYGILKPLDLIQPYRLEMGTQLQIGKHRNLYDFWGDAIQKNVLKDLESQKSDLLINLASKEYFTVLGKMPEHINVVSPVFKDYKNGKHKIISFYAKRARGLMARWIIENNIKDFEKLSKFNIYGYYFSKPESTVTEPVFLRD